MPVTCRTVCRWEQDWAGLNVATREGICYIRYAIVWDILRISHTHRGGNTCQPGMRDGQIDNGCDGHRHDYRTWRKMTG